MANAPYPGLHPDLWDLVRAMADDPDATPDHLRPIADLRAGVARMEAAMPPLPSDITTHDWHLQQGDRMVRLRSYTAPGARAEVMVYFHGGGWSLGTLRGHDLVCADIARDTGLRVVSVDYALAPEHPYPIGLHDCVAAVDHVSSGKSPLGAVPRLWLGGDSAGGNLALGVAQHRTADGLFLIYPATDPACASPSYTAHAHAPYLSAKMMHRCWQDYLNGQTPDPYAAPALAEGARFPKAIILTAALDPLLNDGEALATAMRDASNLIWYDCAEGLSHGFLRFRHQAPAAQSAFQRATLTLRAWLIPGP